MKILHVETGRHLYGGALQVFFLLRGLQAKACTNYLVCDVGSEIGKKSASVVDQVFEVPINGDLDFPFIFKLRKIIKTVRPDIIHLHSRRGADVLGGLAALFLGVRVVLSRRVDNPEPVWVASIKYRLYDRVITISHGIKKVLMSEGVAKKKITCVPSAVDFDLYQFEPDQKWFELTFGKFSNQPIAMVAQLIERKGHQYLLEAIPQVLEHFPHTKFIIFGQGPRKESIKKIIKDAGLENNVLMAGFRGDIEKILPCLTMLVHPALMEGLGIALLQAAAAGLPIVACDAGGMPEIVKDGVNGFLVPPANSELLAKAMIKVLADEKMASSMGAAGKEIVRKEFSIDSMVNGNFSVYQNLLPD